MQLHLNPEFLNQLKLQQNPIPKSGSGSSSSVPQSELQDQKLISNIQSLLKELPTSSGHLSPESLKTLSNLLENLGQSTSDAQIKSNIEALISELKNSKHQDLKSFGLKLEQFVKTQMMTVLGTDQSQLDKMLKQIVNHYSENNFQGILPKIPDLENLMRTSNTQTPSSKALMESTLRMFQDMLDLTPEKKDSLQNIIQQSKEALAQPMKPGMLDKLQGLFGNTVMGSVTGSSGNLIEAQFDRFSATFDSAFLKKGDNFIGEIIRGQNNQGMFIFNESKNFSMSEMNFFLKNQNISPTSRNIEAMQFMSMYEGAEDINPQILRNLNAGFLKTESMLGPGQELADSQKDLLFKFLLANDGKALSHNVLDKILKNASYQQNDLNLVQDPSLNQLLESVSKTMEHKVFTGSDILRLLEQLQEKIPMLRNSDSVKQLIDQVQLNQFDQQTNDSPQQEVYWFGNNNLQKGRLTIQDERKKNKKGDGEDGSVKFQLDTQAPNIGDISVLFHLKEKDVNITLKDHGILTEEIVESEREVLARDMASLGWELHSIFLSPIKTSKSINITNVSFGNSSGFDIKA